MYTLFPIESILVMTTFIVAKVYNRYYHNHSDVIENATIEFEYSSSNEEPECEHVKKRMRFD